MNNGLSQEEIDALLHSDTDTPAQQAPDAVPDDKPAPKKKAAPNKASKTSSKGSNLSVGSDALSPEEIDAMGEVGNISMGTSATTLFAMLHKRVDITTPRVIVTNMRKIAQEYPLPFVVVEVSYTKGLEGTNVLFLREEDVKIITDLLMGGDGTNTQDDVSDMHLSAIGEVMNQMVGSASTSLAKLINTAIDISPPKAYQVDLAEQNMALFDNPDEPIVCTCFDMQVEGLINSEIMQVMPVKFAKTLIRGLLKDAVNRTAQTVPLPEPKSAPVPPQESVAAPSPAAEAAAPSAAQPITEMPTSAPYAPPPPMQPVAPTYVPPGGPMVDVRPMQYTSFHNGDAAGAPNSENMDLLLDVPLPVTVELGKSRKYIKEILDFNVGSIIVLDKMAGEMVDILVNGKLIAKGEVVVIDDNYGARITDIISPSRRV